MYAIGGSQSAMLLTTYINAIHEKACLLQGKTVFDGFMLTVGATPIPINQDAEHRFSPDDPRNMIKNSSVPVIRFMSESEFRSMNIWPMLPTRRADSDALNDRFRLYEVPGVSHSVSYTNNARPNSKVLEKIGVKQSAKPNYIVNNLPAHYLWRGALVNLDKWVREGTPPPHAQSYIVVDNENVEMDVYGKNMIPTVVRDGFGNAVGGLRTPYVDLPFATYAMYPKGNRLSGEVIPFDKQKFEQLYGNREAYMQKFSAYVDAMTEQRWVTKEDGEQMKRDIASDPAFSQ